MNISKQNALRIVTEISAIINQLVNLMDESGCIIASTDKARIDTYHEGAHQIITNRLDELIVYEDDEYEGARKGINLPLMLENQTVGVIGITGDYQEVYKYGQIAKKMTEILILDNHIKTQKSLDDRIRDRFLSDWILKNDASNSNEMTDRGNLVGIDIKIHRRVFLCEIIYQSQDIDSLTRQALIDKVSKTIKKMLESENNNIFASISNYAICLVKDCENDELRALIEKINAKVLEKHGVQLFFGVDKKELKIHEAFEKANKAINSILTSKSNNICFYEDMNCEIFIGEVSARTKLEFINKVFNSPDEKELKEMISLLTTYFQENGSINECSNKLFIHKNTLQYKLNKIQEKTGKDPRITSDAALFYLAIAFFNFDALG